MVPDTRDVAEITKGIHAVAHVRGWRHVVRGIDRFTYLPDRTPAAVVWIADKTPFDRHRTAEVALADIDIHPGSSS